ncbi:MAG: hypothetical protein F4Y26_11740 [Gammaproteobacteria bacterium]|nr:hypothetical protein [Gammaproteobacteria bacterium]
MAFFILPASPLGIDLPTVGGEAYACESPGLDDPIGFMGMVFGVVGLIGIAVPPVAAIFGIAAIGFGAWSYFGFGGYDGSPCG